MKSNYGINQLFINVYFHMLKHRNPLISVIIPTYNRCYKVVRAIQSVLNQTYGKVEILVVDDGSTDETITYLKKKFTNQIKLICLQHSGHPNISRNAAIKRATGEYISFLDSDDWYLPEKLEKQINFLHQHPEYDAVYCDMKLFDKNNHVIADSWFRNRARMKQGDIFKYNLFLFDSRNTGFELYLNELLIPKYIFDEIGLLSIKFEFLEDWEFILRLSAGYSIGCIKQSLVVAERRSGDNYAGNFSKSYRMNPSRYTVPILEHLKKEKLPQSSEQIQEAIRHYYLISTKRQLKCGSLSHGFSAWFKFLHTQPNNIQILKSMVLVIKGIIRRYF
jgi:glycosyltransferase involved in cell wall biosynthesis